MTAPGSEQRRAMREMPDDVAKVVGLHDRLAVSHPSLARGQVWCRACGHTETVSSAYALKHGWPKHCGATMTIDSPEEQARPFVRAHLEGEAS